MRAYRRANSIRFRLPNGQTPPTIFRQTAREHAARPPLLPWRFPKHFHVSKPPDKADPAAQNVPARRRLRRAGRLPYPCLFPSDWRRCASRRKNSSTLIFLRLLMEYANHGPTRMNETIAPKIIATNTCSLIKCRAPAPAILQ